MTVSKLFLAPARYNLIIAWRTVETFHTDTKITCQSVQVLRNMKRYVRTFYWIGIQTGSNRTMFLMSKLLLKNKRNNLSLVQIDLHSPPARGSAFLVLESLRKHKKRNYFGFACSRFFFSCFASFSSLDKAHFFSAFYKNLDKLIQNNISEIHTR